MLKLNLLKLKHKEKFKIEARHLVAALLAIGTSTALAAIPRAKDISNDTSIYQSIREIRLTKNNPDYEIENGLNKLSAQEKRYRRSVPMRLSAPMERIENAEYRPSGSKNRRK